MELYRIQRGAEDDDRKRFSIRGKICLQAEEEHVIKTSDYAWIVDSGATRHMTPNKHWLRRYQEFDSPIEVFMGDGNPSLAYGEGDMSFTNELLNGKLSGVLWVPNLKQNLFSVRKAMSNGYNVHFDQRFKGHCIER